MARDIVDSTPLEGRNALVAWFEQGNKPETAFRIGTEHEKFPFYSHDLSPVPYDGRKGIRALLEGMQGLLGWDPIMEGDHPIGLFDVTGGGAISLERVGSSNCPARRSRPCTRPRSKQQRISPSSSRSPIPSAFASLRSACRRSGAGRKRLSCRNRATRS